MGDTNKQYGRNEKYNEEKGEQKTWRPQPRPGNLQNYRPQVPRREPKNEQSSRTPMERSPTYATHPTHRVVYHKRNDFSEAKKLVLKPEDFQPKAGPGMTPEIERDLGPCELIKSYKYGNWTDTVFPSSDENLVRGMAQALALVIQVACKGPESVNHETAFLGVEFLSTIRNDAGEIPPNVLAFLEYIDYYTRNDDTEKAEFKFQAVD